MILALLVLSLRDGPCWHVNIKFRLSFRSFFETHSTISFLRCENSFEMLCMAQICLCSEGGGGGGEKKKKKKERKKEKRGWGGGGGGREKEK